MPRRVPANRHYLTLLQGRSADEQRRRRGKGDEGRGQWEKGGRRGRDVNLDEGLNSLDPLSRKKVRGLLSVPLVPLPAKSEVLDRTQAIS